jgi:small subunit ribosomal protein S17
MAEEEQQDEQQSEAQEETSEPQTAAEEAAAPEAAPEGGAEAAAEPEEAEAEVEAPDATPVAEAAPSAEAVKRVRPKKKRLPRSQRRQRTKPRREKPAERRPIIRLPKPERERGRKQERRGVVVSSAMDKTIVVQVETVKAHSRYKKVVRRSRRFHAHDAENAAKVGDIVRIVESRPLSKTKTWRLAEIVEQAR